MKQSALLLSILVFELAGLAQDVSQLPPSDEETAASASGQLMTVQGCLSGSEGNFLLTQDNTNAAYVLTGAEDELKQHIGHEVSATGQMVNPVAAPSTSTTSQRAGEKPGSEPDSLAPHDQPQRRGSGGTPGRSSVLKISRVQMIANRCASSP